MASQVRQKIIEAANSQINVPYHKDIRLPGVAFDCVQFVGWCYEQALNTPVNFPLQGPCAGFLDNRIIDYIKELGGAKISLSQAKEGDVVIWTYKGVPHHTGMIYSTNPLWVVHSCATYRKVAHHPLGGEWGPGRRFHSAWNLLDD